MILFLLLRFKKKIFLHKITNDEKRMYYDNPKNENHKLILISINLYL